MSQRVLIAVLCGLGVGGGLVLLAAALRGREPRPPEAKSSALADWARAGGLLRLGIGVVVAVVVFVVTGWYSVALALGGVAMFWKQLFGGAREEKAAMERIEGLASWTESLRDSISTGNALAQVLPASVSAASPSLQPALLALVDRLHAREPIADALLGLADDLNDASADLTIAALALNAQAQGKNLKAVLTALARSARTELEVRLKIEAERRSVRRGTQIVLIVTAAVAVGMSVFNPSYVTPYNTAQGQLMLSIIVVIFGAGCAWMRRLASFKAPERFLVSHATLRTAPPAATPSPRVPARASFGGQP